jgi:hypothetical protein
MVKLEETCGNVISLSGMRRSVSCQIKGSEFFGVSEVAEILGEPKH